MKIRKCIVAVLCMCCLLSAVNTPVAVEAASSYTSDKESVSVSGGGTLYSYTERQSTGSVNGNVRKVKFYVYAKYSGSQTVTSIKCSWKTGAKLRNSATLTLNTSVGSSYSVSASASSTYQNVESSTKYWNNTNGATISYEASNFTIAPKSDLYGTCFWVTSTARVTTKGYSKPTSISSGC